MVKKPQKPEVVMPVKPESPKPALMDGGIIGISIFALFIGAMGLFLLLTAGMQWPVVILLIIGVLGGSGVYKAKSDATNLSQIAEETYQKTLNGYNINVSKHNQRYSETNIIRHFQH